MGFKITHIETQLGNNKINVKNYLNKKIPDEKVSKIIDKTGFKYLHREKSKNIFDLAFTSSKNLLKKINTKPDILVFITQDPINNIPSFAENLAHKLKLKDNTFVTTLSMSCSSYPYALFIVNSLFNSSFYNNAIIVSSEIYSNLIEENDNASNLIFSDGSCSSFIEKVSSNNLISYDFGHKGSKFDKIMYRNNNSGSKKNSYSGNLSMMGAEVLQFTMSEIPKSIISISKKLKLKEIELFFFHQASKVVIDEITSKLALREEQVPNSFNLTGNLVSSSIPFLINSYLKKNKIKKNKIICISGFGVGLSWGSIIFKWQ
jgi:3-oxoacyl-[acyl-carrier-protein] synthase-3